jgi:hypothetical protein
MRDAMPTGIAGLDIMLDGGLPGSGLVEVFGERAVGKSVLSLQCAFAAAASGTNVLVIDTELGYEKNLLPYWTKSLKERFASRVTVHKVSPIKSLEEGRKKRATDAVLKEALKNLLTQYQIEASEGQLSQVISTLSPVMKLSADKAQNAIYILEEPGMPGLMGLHGIDGEFCVSEGGRVELRLKPGGVREPENSPVGSFVRDNSVGLLIYDSISAPAKSTFTGTQDLPARSTSFAFLLGQAQKISSRSELPVLAVNHISVHPHNPAWTHPYGGLIVGYDFKYVFHLEREPSESKLREYPIINRESVKRHNRVLWSYRHPRVELYGQAALLNLDENGFS